MQEVITEHDIRDFLTTTGAFRLRPRLEIVEISSNFPGFVYVDDITDLLQVRGTSIERNSYDPLGGRARFVISDKLHPEALRGKYLRAWVDIVSDEKKQFIGRGMGVYIPKIPNQKVADTLSYSYECVDSASLLDNDLRSSFSTEANEQARVAIGRAFKSAGVNLNLVLPFIDYVFSDNSGEVWIAGEGNTWLSVINDMLRSTGNINLYSGRQGELESRPYYFLDRTAPIWEFSSASGISWDTEVETNFWEIPNRWTGLAEESSFIDSLMEASYTLFNLNDGETSFEVVNRWVDRSFKVDAFTREGLENAVRWRAQLDRQIALKINIQNSWNPLFWVGDVVNVNLPDIRSRVLKGVVTNWVFPFDRVLMSITVEVPV